MVVVVWLLWRGCCGVLVVAVLVSRVVVVVVTVVKKMREEAKLKASYEVFKTLNLNFRLNSDMIGHQDRREECTCWRVVV